MIAGPEFGGCWKVAWSRVLFRPGYCSYPVNEKYPSSL